MSGLTTLEWVGLIASLITILSVIFNIYQWKRRKDVEDYYYNQLSTIYNHMYRIAELADSCKVEFEKDKKPNPYFINIIRRVEQCTGIADSVRQEAKQFARNIFGKSLKRDLPHEEFERHFSQNKIKDTSSEYGI